VTFTFRQRICGCVSASAVYCRTDCRDSSCGSALQLACRLLTVSNENAEHAKLKKNFLYAIRFLKDDIHVKNCLYQRCLSLSSACSPTPVISWNKSEGQMPADGRFQLSMSDSAARITHLRSSDAGIYVCEGSSAQHTSSLKIEIELVVEGRRLSMAIIGAPTPLSQRIWTARCSLGS